MGRKREKGKGSVHGNRVDAPRLFRTARVVGRPDGRLRTILQTRTLVLHTATSAGSGQATLGCL
jgi:hypothetical protein